MGSLGLVALMAAVLFCGCQTANNSLTATGAPFRKDKHLQHVWVAEGFDFTGYDALQVSDTRFQATERPNETEIRNWAIQYLQDSLAGSIRKSTVFPEVVTRESDVKPGTRVLKLENTIVEYEKGGGAGRYFAGIYGAGQPKLRVRGKFLDGEKPVCEFESWRSGDSGSDRVFGGFVSDQDIQRRDIDDLSKDLADFIARTARYTPR